MSYALHENQGNYMPRRVWFSGTTALLKGQGMCFDLDYVTTNTGETAADAWEKRANTVQVPSASNAQAFAGVTSRAYAAAAAGQWIEIYEPGSVCEVALAGTATTINSTVLTCMASSPAAGRFDRAGYMGRGSCLALQTVAASATEENCPVSEILAGTFTASSGQIAKTGIESYAVAGDTAIVVAGADDDGGAVVTPYATTVATVGTNYITLTTAPSTENGNYTVMVYRGKPTCLALLLTGEESGLTQWISFGSDTLISEVPMVGGTTFIESGITPTADYTHAIAASTKGVTRKAFIHDGVSTTNDFLITGIVTAAGAAANSVELDADLECVHLVYAAGRWVISGGVCTVA